MFCYIKLVERAVEELNSELPRTFQMAGSEENLNHYPYRCLDLFSVVPS